MDRGILNLLVVLGLVVLAVFDFNLSKQQTAEKSTWEPVELASKVLFVPNGPERLEPL